MKRLTLLFLVLIIHFFAVAQNHCVYIRYNPGDGNASSIVWYVEELMKSDNTVIVFLSKSNHSMISKNLQEWDVLKNEILSMQSSPDLYASIELDQLNQLLTESLQERVETTDENTPSIIGALDNHWDIRFLLSEEMFNQANDIEIVPLEFISVNELQKRFSVFFFSYNEDGDINKHVTPYNEMFNF